MCVKFTSNKKSEAAGARCSIQCAKAALPPPPTLAPPPSTGDKTSLLQYFSPQTNQESNSGSSFTCPKGPDKTEETFSVKAGDLHTFKTNKAPKYGKNIKCTVNYIIKASCNMMELKCKLELGWGDFFYVQTDDFLKYEMITAHCTYFKYMRRRINI